MTNEEKVKAKFPAAYAHTISGGWWWVDYSRNTPMLGEGKTEADAWVNAEASVRDL